VPTAGTVPCPPLSAATIRLGGVAVVHPGRELATPCGLDAAIRPGRVLALVGPSGVGKSTAVQVLLGLRRPDAGQVTVTPDGGTPVELGAIDPASWFAQVAWVPQRPLLVPGTLAENLRLVAPDATDTEMDDAARASGLDTVLAALPEGWRTRIGQGGHGLSAGQRQRLAVARALLRPAALVVLDEPTAHLDPATQEIVHAAVRRLRGRGAAVVLVAHRPALVALADDVVTVVDGPVPDATAPPTAAPRTTPTGPPPERPAAVTA
jgi:ATP-binding cassette subfamily C protein CydD